MYASIWIQDRYTQLDMPRNMHFHHGLLRTGFVRSGVQHHPELCRAARLLVISWTSAKLFSEVHGEKRCAKTYLIDYIGPIAQFRRKFIDL